jgi:hypothetical protein
VGASAGVRAIKNFSGGTFVRRIPAYQSSGMRVVRTGECGRPAVVLGFGIRAPFSRSGPLLSRPVPCRGARTDAGGAIGREALDAGMVASGARTFGRRSRSCARNCRIAFKRRFCG